MPTYSFICPSCGKAREVHASIHTGPDPQLCPCGAHMRRRFHAPTMARSDSFDTHFNHSVGRVISNRAEFRSALTEKSDEMSERLGMPVNLKELPPDAHPNRGELVDINHKRQLDQGEIEPKRVFG